MIHHQQLPLASRIKYDCLGRFYLHWTTVRCRPNARRAVVHLIYERRVIGEVVVYVASRIVVATALNSSRELELICALVVMRIGASDREAKEQRRGKPYLERSRHVDGGVIERRHGCGQRSSFHFGGHD